MNICLKSVIVGLVGAALTFFYLNKRDKKIEKDGVLGLLQGNPLPKYQATYLIKIKNETSNSETAVLSALYKRFRLLPDTATFVRKGNGIIEIKSETDDTTLKEILFTSYDVSFHEMYTLPELAVGFKKMEELNDTDPVEPPKSDLLSDQLAYEAKKKRLLENLSFSTANTSEIGFVHKKDLPWFDSLFSLPSIRSLFPADLKFLYSLKTETNSDNSATLGLYAIKTNKRLWEPGDNHIKNAVQTFDPVNGIPVISVELDNYGAILFEDMTRRNIGRPIAILSNNEVIVAPFVTEPISKGELSLSGHYSINDAVKIAYKLKAGRLPAEIEVLKADFVQTNKKPLFNIKTLLISALAFLLFSIASFFIFRLLKPLKTR